LQPGAAPVGESLVVDGAYVKHQVRDAVVTFLSPVLGILVALGAVRRPGELDREPAE
jgi:hypothetical protein